MDTNIKPEDIHITTEKEKELMKDTPELKMVKLYNGDYYDLRYKIFKGQIHVISFDKMK